MNFLTNWEIVKKLEEWANQKIPELVPGPKLEVMVRLNRLVGDHIDELIKSLRLAGKSEWAKIVKEDYEKLKDATKRATSDSLKRIVEFKMDRLDKQHNEISALDILDPNFKIPTDKPWKDREIPRTAYFDECAQCARQLSQTLRQVVAKAKATDELSPIPSVFYKRWWIPTCLGKIFEKGWQIFTKNFWETLFERMWPK